MPKDVKQFMKDVRTASSKPKQTPLPPQPESAGGRPRRGDGTFLPLGDIQTVSNGPTVDEIELARERLRDWSALELLDLITSDRYPFRIK